jgi:proton glutamate symport protein
MKKLSITAWIFICMAIGITLGYTAPKVAVELEPISNIFLRLIKSIIAPLLFGTLVSGIAGTGSVKAMGRIGAKAILYFEIATTIALFIGLGAVNLVQPGVGMKLDENAAAINVPKANMSFSAILEHAFPTSVFDSMARGDVLQLVVFSMLFGTACAAIGSKAKVVVDFAGSLAEVMFTYTKYVMYLAPLGVGAAIAVTVGSKGIDVLLNLGKLIATLYGALLVFVIFVLGGIMAVARIPLGRFIKAVKEPWIIAFSTASSEAALPLAMKNMEDFGVPKHIVAFVIPTGYSFNLDGTTMYLALASVFVAQAAGVQMSLGQQLIMMLTLMLTSKGVAAVPRASLIILAGTLTTFNLPLQAISVIMGVDAVLDMARTSVNVLGNCLACAVVARWEGYSFDRPQALPDAERIVIAG